MWKVKKCWFQKRGETKWNSYRELYLSIYYISIYFSIFTLFIFLEFEVFFANTNRLKENEINFCLEKRPSWGRDQVLCSLPAEAKIFHSQDEHLFQYFSLFVSFTIYKLRLSSGIYRTVKIHSIQQKLVRLIVFKIVLI